MTRPLRIAQVGPVPTSTAARECGRTSGVVAPASRNLPMAMAANVPFARQDETFMANYGVSESAPAGTISSLPPHGVVIVAVLPFPSGGGPAPPHFGDFPDRRLPLQLSDARVNRQWQSQPRPNAPESSRTSTSMVGLPRESRIWRACAEAIALNGSPPLPCRSTRPWPRG